MAGKPTEKQKLKIVADFLELGTVNATAKRNGFSWATTKKVLDESKELEKKLEEKKQQDTADILAYMDSKKDKVIEIVDIGLTLLPEKLKDANPVQITTVIGTLFDKWTTINGSGPVDTKKEDELSRSLREMAEDLRSDE